MSDTVWDPHQYNNVADFVPKLGEPLIALLTPMANDRILDLGCGDGSLSEKLVPLCKELIGIDASEQMIEAAKVKGISAFVKDAHQMTYAQEFDAVFSNAALHWMREPQKVINNIYNSLKPSGVFVAEFGGYGNADAIVKSLSKELELAQIAFQNPWYFPTAEHYGCLLASAGFDVTHIELFERFTPLNGHIQDWIRAFGQSFFKDTTAIQKQMILDRVTETVKETLLVDGVWHVDYVRLRVKAVKR